MKKISIVLLAVAMLFGFTACNPAGPSTDVATETAADYIDDLSAQKTFNVFKDGYSAISTALNNASGEFDTTADEGKLALTGSVTFEEGSAVVKEATVNIAMAEGTDSYNGIFKDGSSYSWTEGTATVKYNNTDKNIVFSSTGVKIDSDYTLAFEVTIPESYFGDLSGDPVPGLPAPETPGLSVTISLNGTSVSYAEVYKLTENGSTSN